MYRRILLLGIMMAMIGCHAEAPKPLDRLSENEMTTAGVPPLVRQAFERAHPSVNIERVRKLITDKGDVHYEFRFKESDGRIGEADYNTLGQKMEP